LVGYISGTDPNLTQTIGFECQSRLLAVALGAIGKPRGFEPHSHHPRQWQMDNKGKGRQCIPAVIFYFATRNPQTISSTTHDHSSPQWMFTSHQHPRHKKTIQPAQMKRKTTWIKGKT